MAKVKKEFKQLTKDSFSESDLMITVDFNPSTQEVDNVISVEVFSYKKGVFTDITSIITEHFEDSLEKIIQETDWCELYIEQGLPGCTAINKLLKF